MTHQQQTAFENIVEKGEIAHNEQFLLFPQCFQLNQITVSGFVYIFDIISLFAVELEESKTGLSGIGLALSQTSPVFFSSPEHEVLMVSYCDRAVSGVRRASSINNFLPCVRSRGHSFGRILMKVGQDVCLDEISYEFENGSCGVKN